PPIRKEPALRLISNELQRTDEPNTPNLPHERMLGKLTPTRLQVRPGVIAHPLDNPLLLQNTDVPNRDSTSNRMPGIGITVVKLTTLLNEHLGNTIAHHHRTQRLIARSNALGQSHDVGPEPEVLMPKPLPEPPKPADHLIRNQQNPILIANTL